jgi:aspartyl-tRNA(Asn)/glutamyl-tRNA(Gln) amidotransferase subunit A
MASSLDHIGVFSKTVEDTVILLSAVSGQDPHDATSIPFTLEEAQAWKAALDRKDCAGKKIAIPEQFFDDGLDPEVKSVCLEAIERLKEA